METWQQSKEPTRWGPKLAVLLALGVAAVWWLLRPEAPASDGLAGAIDAIVEEAMEDGPISGVSIGVARGRRVLHSAGYGFADLENSIPATAETVYRVGSITKQFTAATVMQLVEQGDLELSAPITRYLPDYDRYGSDVTVTALLNHTAGIKNYTTMEEWWRTLSVEMRPVDLIDVFLTESLDFEPGTRFSYSNSGYVLLGLATERVSGRPFGGLLNERVFVPQALDRSGYCDDRRLVTDRARGYAVEGDDFVNADHVSMSQAYAAGAVCSNVFDLLRWTRALVRGEVVEDRSLELMTTPGTLRDGTRIEYGFGLAVSFLEGKRRFTHVGGMLGFAGQLSHYPDDDLTIVVLTNTEASAAASLESAIAREVFELGAEDIRDVALDATALARYEGVYDLTITRTRVVAEAGHLLIDVDVPGLEGRHRLLYQGDDRFVAEEDAAVSLTFRLEDGVASGFEIYHKGITMQAVRIEG